MKRLLAILLLACGCRHQSPPAHKLAATAAGVPNPVNIVDGVGAGSNILGTVGNPMVITGTTVPSGTVGGDLCGSLPDAGVCAINGTSVPDGGGLTTGNVLQVSGPSSDTYGPVNLAGGAAYVTGTLPSGNTTYAGITGGDVSCTSGGTCTVGAISGSTPIVVSPNELQFKAASTPLIDQAATDAGASTITIQSQASTADSGVNNATGIVAVNLPNPQTGGTKGYFALEQGGSVAVTLGNDPASTTFSGLFSGAPSSSDFIAMSNGTNTYVNAPNGSMFVCSGGTGGCGFTETATNLIQMTYPVGGSSSTPFAWNTTASAIACSTGGTQTVTGAQAGTPGLSITSGTLSSDCTIDLGTNGITGWYVFDVSGSITLNGHNLVFKNGNQSQTYAAIPAKGLIVVWPHGTNHIVTAP